MSVSRCGALLLTVALAAPVVRAQQQQPPSFRSSTALVAVDAAVVDKDGKPVTDLTAADFEIVEDGVSHAPQTIYLVSSDPAFVRAGNASTDANAPTSTTVPTRRELRSRVIVFFLDLDHLSADGYKRSRTAIEGFLKDSAASADLVGVLAGGQMLNNKIDTDKPALLKAMASMKGPNFARYDDMRMWPRILDDAEANDIARTMEETINRVVQRACIDDPDQCRDREMVRAMVESKARNITSIAARQADLSLLMLETVTKGLSRLPGTKQVIAFSDGFFTGERVGRLKALVETAAQNNVRFSTMDARGLGRDIRSREFMAAGPVVAAGDNSAVTMDANSDVLATLALDTGGEMFINRNDLRPAVDRVVQAAGTYYVLGYAPTRAMDGKYHAVTVKVRRAGVTILARRGYVASPVQKNATPSLTQRQAQTLNQDQVDGIACAFPNGYRGSQTQHTVRQNQHQSGVKIVNEGRSHQPISRHV